MRKFLRRGLPVLLALTVFVPLAASPASADFAASINYCVGDDPTNQCWNIRGVAATVQVHAPSLACNNAQHVESIYIIYEWNNNVPYTFVEFGWAMTQNYLCQGSPKQLFIRAMDRGVYKLSCDGCGQPNLGLGDLRLKIFQWSTDTDAIFRFSYDPPGATGETAMSQTYNATDTVPTHPWYHGQGRTAMEVNNPTDSCGKYHHNVWLQADTYLWRAANSDQNAELDYRNNGTVQCGSQKNPGFGATYGDDVDYWML